MNTKFLWVVLTIFICSSFKVPPLDRGTDKDRVDAAIREYMAQMNHLFSANASRLKIGETYFAQLKPSTSNLVDHSNDLQYFSFALDRDAEIGLSTYTRLLGSDYKGKVNGEFIESSIISDDCPVTMLGQEVYLVAIEKELTHNGKTRVFDFLIGVTLKSEYPISFVYYTEVARSEKNIPTNKSCTTDIQEKEREELRQRQFKILKTQATEFYQNLEYFEAREAFKKALDFNAGDQDLIDAIASCNYFIKEQRKEIIQKLLDEKKYEKALGELTSIDDTENNDSWFAEKTQECEYHIQKIVDQSELKRADILFNSHQEKQALVIYESLQQSKHIDKNYLSAQILKSKESDPLFIKKALKKAYDNAVKSDKKYFETFETYSKYESSRQLSGEQYYFMCMMMLNKHSVVAKPMGFSKNQAKLLSRVYFYKAKDLGINVSVLETQIFTKSIEKRKN